MSMTSGPHLGKPTADAARPANPYRPVRAVLEDVIVETPTIKSFVMRPDEPIRWVTGQFVEVAVPGLGEAPYTPSGNQKDTERLVVTVDCLAAYRIVEQWCESMLDGGCDDRHRDAVPLWELFTLDESEEVRVWRCHVVPIVVADAAGTRVEWQRPCFVETR